MFKYLVLRWLPVLGAALSILFLALWLPGLVLGVFWLNSLWMPYAVAVFEWLGAHMLAPLLPPGVWTALTEMLTAVRGAYSAFVTVLHALTYQLPTEYGARTEVFVRTLLAEGWILIAEIAFLIRFLLARKIRYR